MSTTQTLPITQTYEQLRTVLIEQRKKLKESQKEKMKEVKKLLTTPLNKPTNNNSFLF